MGGWYLNRRRAGLQTLGSLQPTPSLGARPLR
jgi:hypothetical protein